MIVEDDVLVGGNTGIYEGTVIKQGAVIAAGVILTASTPCSTCRERGSKSPVASADRARGSCRRAGCARRDEGRGT